MDRITSRKNAVITHLRALGAESAYRAAAGEYLCDGYKLLDEALKSGAVITSVLWKEGGARSELVCDRQYSAPPELFDYASPMKNSPGPLFTVRRDEGGGDERVQSAIVLENVQDPGNVGTVLRTASAFSIDAVVLLGGVLTLSREESTAWLKKQGLKLYGAALSERATDVRKVDITHSAIAVGSEGHGLSRELLDLCDGEIIIPMDARSESLNAAVAASVLMWEMARDNT